MPTPRQKQQTTETEERSVNQRQHERHARTVLLWFTSVETDGGEPLQGISYCFNISRGGFGAVVTMKIPLGTLLFVEMIFNRESLQMSAVGRVVYTREVPSDRWEIGFEFLALPPDGANFFEHCLPLDQADD